MIAALAGDLRKDDDAEVGELAPWALRGESLVSPARRADLLQDAHGGRDVKCGRHFRRSRPEWRPSLSTRAA